MYIYITYIHTYVLHRVFDKVLKLYPHHTGVPNLRNTTNSEDTITVTWDAASYQSLLWRNIILHSHDII